MYEATPDCLLIMTHPMCFRKTLLEKVRSYEEIYFLLIMNIVRRIKDKNSLKSNLVDSYEMIKNKLL